MRWVLGLVLGAGTYAAFVLAVLTLPGDNPVPAFVWVLAFVAMFPVHLAAILSVKAARAGRRLSVPWPRRAVIAGVAAYGLVSIAVLVVSVATTPAGIPAGQPDDLGDGRYALNNHGELTYITYAEYLRYLELSERGFVGIAQVFCLIGAALVAGSLDYRSASDKPMDRAEPRTATPYPLTADWRRPYEDAAVVQAIGWLALGGVSTACVLWYFAGSWRWWFVLLPMATTILVRSALVGLLVNEHGVRIRSFWRTLTVAWADLAAVTVAPSGILGTDTIWLLTRGGRTVRTPVRRGSWYTVPHGTVARLGHRVAATERFRATVRLLSERAFDGSVAFGPNWPPTPRVDRWLD